MTPLPSRLGALALLCAAASLPGRAPAQAAPDGQPAPAEMVHTDSQGRHLAPHDTFYLVDYVSVRTDKGVDGFTPGQEVHLVEVHREAHTLVVSDGHAQVEVPPSKLTNDLDIAALVRQRDAANQAQVAAYIQAEEAAYQQYQRYAAEVTNQDLERHRQEQRQEQEAEARARQQAQATPTPATTTTAASDYSGYYNNGGYGYGSPYSYFAGGPTAVAPGTATAPATAPATNAPAANNPGKVAAPAGGGGRVK